MSRTKIKTASFVDNAVTTAKIATDAVTSAKIPANAIGSSEIDLTANYTFTGNVASPGQVIQVVNSFQEISNSTTSSSYVDSGMQVIITPSSASNKILLMLSFCTQHGGSRSRFTIHSSASGGVLHGADNQGFVAAEGNANANFMVTFHHLDTPNTTSAITYKMQYLNTGSTSTFLVNDNPQVFTAMEIAQ